MNVEFCYVLVLKFLYCCWVVILNVVIVIFFLICLIWVYCGLLVESDGINCGWSIVEGESCWRGYKILSFWDWVFLLYGKVFLMNWWKVFYFFWSMEKFMFFCLRVWIVIGLLCIGLVI